MLVAYIIATIADLVTSIIARRNPRLGEGNLLRFTGRFWIAARIALGVGFAVIALVWPAYAWVLPVGAVVFGLVAVWNIVQIARAR